MTEGQSLIRITEELNHLNANFRAFTELFKMDVANPNNLCDSCPYFRAKSNGYCLHGNICNRIVKALMTKEDE